MKTQIVHYFTLFVILGIGIVTFIFSSGNAAAQLATGIITAIAYVCWGILYHAAKKDLYAKIVVEYVLIALISVIVLFIVIRS